MKRLPNENKYQLDIKDQFKNEFEVGQLQGNNFHMTDSADLPMYIEPQGNIEQEVIEAVEGIVVEGSSINVSDVDTNYEDSITPKGNIEQDTREGYNHLDIKDIFGSSKIQASNITNESIEIETIDYTTDATIYFKAKNLKAGITYKASCLIELLSGVLGNAFGRLELYNGYTWIKAFGYYNSNTKKSSGTFTVDADGTYNIRFLLSSTSDNLTETLKVKVSEFMVYDYTSQTNKPYEQYGSMPSLSFPSEVKGVSGHYDNVVENKNLINFKKWYENKEELIVNTTMTINEVTENSITFTPLVYDAFTATYGMSTTYLEKNKEAYEKWSGVQVEENTRYTVSYERNVSKIRFILFFLDKDFKYLGLIDNIGNGQPITTPNNAKYVTYRVGAEGQKDVQITVSNIQMEKGTVATEYVEHQEQLLPIDIPFNMYSGKPYKENGKWYRKVEYVKERLTSDMNWINQTFNDVLRVNTSYFANIVKKTSPKVYSNCFKQAWEKVFGTLVTGYINFYTNNGLYITTPFTTIGEWKAYLDENEVYVVFDLEAPYAEEITDTTLIEQLEALQNAELYDGVTNINSYKSSEDVADMPLEVHYNFITPSPSVERPSEVLEVGSDEEINYCSEIEVGNINANGESFNDETSIRSKNYDEIEPNTTYIASLNGKAIGFNYTQYDENKTSLGRNYTSNGIFTTNENAKYVRVQALATIDNSIVQINKGTEVTPFTPHGYCRYENVVENKNLAVVEYGEIDSKTGANVVATSTIIRQKTYIPLKLGESIVYSGNLAGTVNVRLYDKDKKYIGYGTFNSGKYYTVTNENVAFFRFRYTLATGETLENIQMQLEYGETKTDYVEHQEQQFLIDLPIGMKMYNDEFFYKDGGDWYFDKKWEKEFITRNSTVGAETTNVVGINRFAFKPTKDFKKNTSATLVLPIYSNILKASSAQDTYLRKNGIAFDPNNIIIYLDECKNMTSKEFKIFCEEHSVYIVYQLANPIPTKITDPILIQELEDISRAFSYYPVTNVNSYKPIVNVADLKLYVEYFKSNKITNK